MIKKFFWIVVLLFSLPMAGQEVSNVVFDSVQFQKRGPVYVAKDTLFYLYDKINGIKAAERAALVNQRLQNIIESPAFSPDSFKVEDLLDYSQITYRGELLVNITVNDAKWYGSPPAKTASEYHEMLVEACTDRHEHKDLRELLIQIGLSLLVLVIVVLVIKYINRLFRWLGRKIYEQKGEKIGALKIRNYELMDEARSVYWLQMALRVIRILVLLIILYFTLPTILKIFPWTEGVADQLFHFVLDPLKMLISSFVEYVPNLFTIAVIVVVIRYITKGVHYLANEILHEKLKISGFYPDWALPTSRLINFILYVFMLVLIWPYLPGSDSAIFQGVSVFLGLLISMGSTSAISNIVSGLVITYMRPFKVGDRVRIGEVSGDIIEKTLLVTRIRTIKNEIITVPNSNILTGSSINYSMSSKESAGLIIHSSVTIGYDVPWRKVHEMLIEAASRTPLIEPTPNPFVLQTSLDDFYVSYQVNAYTHEASSQAAIYSDMHALIQDIFAKNGVEIMSPHYRANREGPDTTPVMNGKSKEKAAEKTDTSKMADAKRAADEETFVKLEKEVEETLPVEEKNSQEETVQPEPPKKDEKESEDKLKSDNTGEGEEDSKEQK